MSSELSGAVSGLSGRVDTLTNYYTYLNQQLLQSADLTSFNSYKVIWNQQIQDLMSSVATIRSQLQIIQNLTTNLSINVTNNLNTFKAHTGLPAVSGHAGL